MKELERCFREMAEYLKALAHPTRLKIMEYLAQEKETCVKCLWEELNLQQSNVSQHLALMKQKGIIDSRKEGVKTCYWIADPLAMEIYNLLKARFLECEESHSQKNEAPQKA